MKCKREIITYVNRLESDISKGKKGNTIFSKRVRAQITISRESHNYLRSSYKERKGNALALGADEGRG